MPGKAIVAATDAMLTTAPPRPAGPPGRMARKACLRPSEVPRMLTSSIVRMSSGSRSTTRLEISTPALLTTMSRPPSSAIVPSTARSQLWSFVTSSGRNAASPPPFLIASAVASPSSSRMSPMTTAAPARASASAIPAPSPRAPPVTRALRPVKSYTLIGHLLLETALRPGGWRCDVGHTVTGSGQSSRLSWTLVKCVLGGGHCPIYSWFGPARRGRFRELTGSICRDRRGPRGQGSWRGWGWRGWGWRGWGWRGWGWRGWGWRGWGWRGWGWRGWGWRVSRDRDEPGAGLAAAG